MNAAANSTLRGVLGLSPLAAMPVILWPGKLHPLLSLTLIGIAVIGLIFIGLHFLPRREPKNRSRDPIIDAMNSRDQSTSFVRKTVWTTGLILFFVSVCYFLERQGYWNSWTAFVFWVAVGIALMSSPPRQRSTRRGLGRRHH